jgi:hypothetical protein
MTRLFALLLASAFGLSMGRAAEKPRPPIRTDEIASPAAPGSIGAALYAAPDGMAWMTWIEPGAAGSNTLRFATLDAAGKKWSAAQTIASQRVNASAMDFPQLAADAAGHAAVVWTDGHGGALASRTADRGVTWSAPAPVTTESEGVEKFSVTVLSDQRVLVAWLDARGIKAGGKMTRLYARILGESGPDVLVDPSVCDCCQTTLASFLDGGALVAYRARTEEEVRDIRVARFRGHAWDEPRPLSNDDWHINACPVNGPRLAADGGRVAAAWFTAADNEPRVLASFSPDAGTRFLMPLRVDRGHPTGHVETLLLRDGAMLVTWLESDGSYWLRRISPDFTADEPIALAPAGAVAAKDFPRSALVRNYAGGDSPAQFITAYAGAGKRGALHTVLVTVREGEWLAAAKDCDCAPTPEQLAGFPIRGTIATVDADRGALHVAHEEIPGVLAAGTHDFRAASGGLATLVPGRRFLGRIERRENAWWLYDVRLLVQPDAAKE